VLDPQLVGEHYLLNGLVQFPFLRSWFPRARGSHLEENAEFQLSSFSISNVASIKKRPEWICMATSEQIEASASQNFLDFFLLEASIRRADQNDVEMLCISLLA
jgi:hypothetical protein